MIQVPLNSVTGQCRSANLLRGSGSRPSRAIIQRIPARPEPYTFGQCPTPPTPINGSQSFWYRGRVPSIPAVALQGLSQMDPVSGSMSFRVVSNPRGADDHPTDFTEESEAVGRGEMSDKATQSGSNKIRPGSRVSHTYSCKPFC